MADLTTPPAAGDPAATSNPPASSPPSPTPSPTPVTPSPTPEALELANTRAEIEKLKRAKLQTDSDLAKMRATNKAAKEALVAAGLMPAEGDADPKLIEEQRRAKAESELRFEASLTRAVLGSGYQARDNDPDLLLFKVQRTPELKALADVNDTAGLIVAMKERGLLLDPKPVTAPPAPAPAPPAPRAGSPNLQASPDPEFAGLDTFEKLMALPWSRVEAFKEKHPNRFAELETIQRNALKYPRSKAVLHTPLPKTN